MNSFQGIFYSVGFGQGKTIALVSVTKADGSQFRRLLIDNERRAGLYQSPDGKDHPDQLLFDFDDFHTRYKEQMPAGEWTPAAITKLYKDIEAGDFPYEVLLVDNAAMLQEELVAMIRDGGADVARELTQSFRGVYGKHERFIRKFKRGSAVDIYGIVKDIIGELLRMCQRNDINVLTSTEAKNVWYRYGTRDMKILGQTAKVLAPWMKYASFVYRLSRTTGNRDLGTAKLVAVPWAIMDTFNPKNSLPGLKPKFEFTWPAFWKMVESRNVTTQEDLDQVKVEESEQSEYEPDPDKELAQKKALWISAAKEAGITQGREDAEGMKALLKLLEQHGLTPDDAVEKFQQGLEAIQNVEYVESK